MIIQLQLGVIQRTINQDSLTMILKVPCQVFVGEEKFKINVVRTVLYSAMC